VNSTAIIQLRRFNFWRPPRRTTWLSHHRCKKEPCTQFICAARMDGQALDDWLQAEAEVLGLTDLLYHAEPSGVQNES
jgi:Protein of unknown function (DUF2934)